jgi:hypothetical protein
MHARDVMTERDCSGGWQTMNPTIVKLAAFGAGVCAGAASAFILLFASSAFDGSFEPNSGFQRLYVAAVCGAVLAFSLSVGAMTYRYVRERLTQA